MAMWDAFEEEWRLHPTVDDLAAMYMDYKPVPKIGEVTKPDPNAMGPAEFARWAKATKGTALAPGM